MRIAFLRIPPSSQVSVDSCVPSILVCFVRLSELMRTLTEPLLVVCLPCPLLVPSERLS